MSRTKQEKPTGRKARNRTSTKWFIAITVLIACALITGCSHEPTAQEVAAQYTEQTARAIIEGSWKIAGAIFLAAIIRGVLNK